MKNLLSLYRAELLSTQDVSGVSQQVTLKGAQLVKLFCTVGAHVRYNKVAVISCSDILSLPFTLSLSSSDGWGLVCRYKKMFAAITDLNSSLLRLSRRKFHQTVGVFVLHVPQPFRTILWHEGFVCYLLDVLLCNSYLGRHLCTK